ncbi:hypothetical protein DXD09_05085 [Ligilactobacillus ruminis]|uniref:Uncharacterized protein n=1 Tax=Ligilactobacillus ruminis TaxID=1623 RepID=A0A8B2Z720_9LACO|nr:hypothetical protein DXD09_05085 [Ligilactobacillus ruminis]
MRQTLILCARVESGHASRQKTGEMCLFCLPAGPNSGCAAPKVDKKRGKCLFFVYRLVQIQGARPRK